MGNEHSTTADAATAPTTTSSRSSIVGDGITPERCGEIQKQLEERENQTGNVFSLFLQTKQKKYLLFSPLNYQIMLFLLVIRGKEGPICSILCWEKQQESNFRGQGLENLCYNHQKSME